MARYIFILILISSLFSQGPYPILPEERKVNWENAGLQIAQPVFADNILNVVTNYGANPLDEGNDDTQPILDAIEDAKTLSGTTIIFFPEGVYLIKEPIFLQYEEDILPGVTFNGNIIFQGEGSNKTKLKFQLVKNPQFPIEISWPCFNFVGEIEETTPAYSSVDLSVGKNTNQLYSPNLPSITTENDWIYFQQYESDSTTHSHHILGQITQIVNPNTGIIKDIASKFYNVSDDLRIYKLNPIQKIGIENMYIERIDDQGGGNEGSNVIFDYAVNCWVQGVQFHYTTEHHIKVKHSSHITISGNYFDNARYKGDGGYGYGVSLQHSTTNTLVENNIFKRLRHAMVVQDGANANVFGYNYSREQEWSCGGGCIDGEGPDINVHGDYAYSNLFEGNVAVRIWLDASHGWNGPFNTFLRNRMSEEHQYLPVFNAHYTNIIGNDGVIGVATDYSFWVNFGLGVLDFFGLFDEEDIKNSSNIIDIYFHYYPDAPDWQNYSNFNHELWYAQTTLGGNTMEYYLNRSFLNDISLYLDSKPDFFEEFDPWPANGPFTNTDYDSYIEEHLFGIPAEFRWQYEETRTFNKKTSLHPEVVVVDQENTTGAFGSIELWESTWNPYLPGTPLSFAVNSNPTLRAEQSVNGNQKFKDWNNTFFLNYNTFTIVPDQPDITAYHRPVYNATIATNFHHTSNTGQIKFRDPWQINHNDATYGNRNKGFSASYVSKTAPYTTEPSSPAGEPQGVFLNIDFDDMTIPHYAVKADPQTFNNIRWDFYGWGKQGNVLIEDGQSFETAVNFTGANATVTAHYQPHLASNLTDAYSTNSQRKIVRTADGKYHTFYISDYYDIATGETSPAIYHAHSSSSDFTEEWPSDEVIIHGFDDIKNLSVDYDGNLIYIVAEYQDGSDTYWLLYRFDTYNNIVSHWPDEYNYGLYYPASYFGNAKPVVAATSDQVMVIWDEATTSKLKYQVYSVSHPSSPVILSDGELSNSSTNSVNPSVAAIKNDYAGKSRFYIVWQNGTSSLEYQFFENNNGATSWPTTPTSAIISSGSGYTGHYYPSIALPEYDIRVNPEPIVTWRGAKKEYVINKISAGGGGTWVWFYRTLVRPKSSSGWGSFYQTGSNATHSTINASNDGYSITLFNQSNGQSSKWIRRTGDGSYSIADLSHNGIQNQVSNGPHLSDMKAIVFNSGSSPYTLSKSTTSFTQGLSKTSIITGYTRSRQGVIKIDTVEFIFNIGDIIIDGQNVNFIHHPDTLPVTSLEELNGITRTDNFHLDPSSQFLFSNVYYTAKSEHAGSTLNATDRVRFRVELVRSADDYVMGTFDDLEYNKDNVFEHANINYQLDCNGVSPGNYYLRLKTDVTGNAEYFLVNGHNTEEDFGKKNYISMTLAQLNIPKEFTLAQNYPNPFNPTTTITFGLPEAGKVKVQVYDIGGRLVKTLVDDQKEAGTYNVTFSADGMASGVYIYRMISGKFIAQKKMLLVK